MTRSPQGVTSTSARPAARAAAAICPAVMAIVRPQPEHPQLGQAGKHLGRG